MGRLMPVSTRAPGPAALAAVALALAAAAPVASAAALPRPNGAWQLVWSDEFDGPAVNTSNWNVYANVSECAMPGCKGNQIELYTADNVFIDAAEGALVLRTKLANVSVPGYTFNVTSGRVDSAGKVNVTFGRVEVRAKLQNDAAASGVHTAHWLLGYACWPVSGEIDIMEQQSPGNLYGLGQQGQALGPGESCASNWAKATSNYHYAPAGPGACGHELHHTGVGTSAWPAAPDPAVNFTAWYTTFAVEWNATDLVYYVNETAVNHVWNGMPGWVNGTAAVPTWPMFVILSQAYMAARPCGDPPSWAWPVEQRIDYVRVYEWVAAGDETEAPASSPEGDGAPQVLASAV